MVPFLGFQLIYVAIAIFKIELIHNSVDNVKDLNGCYDYIVVGLGSAGSVVAKRLAEDPNIRVLGLEAGGPQSAFTDIPPYYSLLTGSVYDWFFSTVKQTRMGLSFLAMIQPRGKVIGGSSTINYMIYNRGNRKDYDNWAYNYGATGWDYESVLPYFIKWENNSDVNIVSANPGYHGTKGPVGVSSPSSPSPILFSILQAMNNLGFNNTDINGPQQSGTMISQNFIKEGLRSSTANSYLEPNPYPKNLFISIHSFVTKIIIENLTAIGVDFIKNNKKYSVYAQKEVIICAGTLQSPQLLMLSGIGPKEHLDQLGINVISDLPVGNNLKDHIIMFNLFSIIKSTSQLISPPPDLKISDLYELYSNKSGSLSQIPSTVTYVSTKYNDDKSWPNTVLWSEVDIYGTDFTEQAARFNNRQEWIEYYSQASNSAVLSFIPFVGRTKSIGTVRLNSTNPFDPPLIQPNLLLNNEDLDNFVEIIRLAFIVMENSTISPLLSTLEKPIPGCSYCQNSPIYKCDAYLKCLVRQIGMSSAHQCGTCRMGPIDRKDVVLDVRLRVKGIKGLRVVDCSIMPDTINANLNSAAIMIGEHGADIIKADNL